MGLNMKNTLALLAVVLAIGCSSPSQPDKKPQKLGGVITGGGMGTITGVSGSTGGGLTGGGTSGAVALGLLTSCSDQQVLRWINGSSAWQCSAAASGVTNSAGNNVITKSNGTNLIASSISDDGTTVGTTEAYGSQALPLNIGGPVRMNFGVPDSQLNGETFLMTLATGTGRTATNGDVFGIVIRNNTSFNTTAGANQNGGIYAQATGTITSGANPLTNIAMECSASGGTTNYCYHGLAGLFQQDGPGSFTAGLTVTGALSATGSTVDTTGATSVALGANVSSFQVPGSTSVNGRIGLGIDPNTDNYEIQTKNTNTAASNTGLSVRIDTTVAASAYGGVDMTRGAAGVGGAHGGMLIGTGWGSTSLSDLDVFATVAGTGINFFSNSTASAALRIDDRQHLDTLGSAVTLTTATCNSTHCTDIGGTVTASSTSMTITFAGTYTGADDSICQVWPVASTTLPTCTMNATAITCSTVVNAAKYKYICLGGQK